MAKKLKPDPETCKGCKFFDPNKIDEYGWCRRFPPVPVVIHDALQFTHAAVPSSHYCGEFKRRYDS